MYIYIYIYVCVYIYIYIYIYIHTHTYKPTAEAARPSCDDAREPANSLATRDVADATV